MEPSSMPIAFLRDILIGLERESSMLPDPISLASSFVGFVDAAVKLKETLSKVVENNVRLRQIKSNVLHELTALERFCCSQISSWDMDEAGEVTTALNELKTNLLDVQARCEMYLASDPAHMPIRIKSWFKRNSIATDIHHLERGIRSCRFRFMAASFARIEYKVIVSQQESRNRLDHIEDLVACMLIQNAQGNVQHFPFLDASEPDEFEINFFRLQTRRLRSRLDDVISRWNSATELPSSNCEVMPVYAVYSPVDSFRKALIKSLQARQHLSRSSPGDLILQNIAYEILELAGYCDHISILGDAQPSIIGHLLKMSELATHVFRVLYHSTSCCEPFAQMLAYGLRLVSLFSTLLGDPQALPWTEQAVSACQIQFEKRNDMTSLRYLISALTAYTHHLFAQGEYEQALDCSRQRLLILRTSEVLDAPGENGLTWHASGEADVVFSSSCLITRSPMFAWREGGCLFDVALCFSLVGRYAEARVAGLDAANCVQALVCMHPDVARYAKSYRMFVSCLHEWVTIVPNPSLAEERAEATSIETIDDPSRASPPSSSTSSLALKTSTSSWSLE
ncbi:hypothetical protein HGRIS_000676 [Hohenbuehelia grisea]|uniref:Uncharacterized protein n=1 Tax=Hohenbuehelia grisea TaxID=104357 RepID=A0ABR3JSI5_9AGAR